MNFTVQRHQTMGYAAWHQPEFALVNKGNTAEIWVRSSAGTTHGGIFTITKNWNANLPATRSPVTDLAANGGTITIYNKQRDNAHVMVGDLVVNKYINASGKPDQFNASGFGLINETTNNLWSIPIRSVENDQLQFHGYKAASQQWNKVMTLTLDGKVGLGGISTNLSDLNLSIGGKNVNGRQTAGIRIINDLESNRYAGVQLFQLDNLTGVLASSGRDLQVESGWSNSLILGNSAYNNLGGQVIIPGGKVRIGPVDLNTRPTGGEYRLFVKDGIRT